MKRLIALVLSALLVATLVSGCAKKPSTTPSSGSGKIVIGIAMDNIDEPFWGTVLVALKAEAAKKNVTVAVTVAQFDANLQNVQVNELIAKHVDAIICAAHDQVSILQAVMKCNAAKIPFIYSERIIKSGADAKVSWGAGTDDVKLSTLSMTEAAATAKAANQKLNFLVLSGLVGDQSSTDRCAGVAAAVAANPDQLALVTTIPVGNDTNAALTGTVNALSAHPNINAIFMISDVDLQPIMSGLTQANRLFKVGDPKHVFLISYGGAKVSLDNIQAGYVDETAIQDCYSNSVADMDAAVKLAQGQDPGPLLDASGFVLTKANYADKAQFAFGSNTSS
jgi:ABC-type sugar transport system substrate-binding protein